MKIGNLQFRDYAAKKPLVVSPTGGFLTASEVVSQPSLSLVSLLALSDEQKIDFLKNNCRKILAGSSKTSVTAVATYWTAVKQGWFN